MNRKWSASLRIMQWQMSMSCFTPKQRNVSLLTPTKLPSTPAKWKEGSMQLSRKCSSLVRSYLPPKSRPRSGMLPFTPCSLRKRRLPLPAVIRWLPLPRLPCQPRVPPLLWVQLCLNLGKGRKRWMRRSWKNSWRKKDWNISARWKESNGVQRNCNLPSRTTTSWSTLTWPRNSKPSYRSYSSLQLNA